MKEVKNLAISDGVIYTGEVKSDGFKDVPHGMGICKYSDHNETGRFVDGELNGLAYLNYHDWMTVGIVRNRLMNGWGLKIDRGKIEFGIYEDNILRVNLTPLVEIFWDKILEDASSMNKNAISVKKNGTILVGTPQTIFQGKFGFNFLANGEIFLGMNKYDQSGLTGEFLHFDTDYNITKGQYDDGLLLREIEDDEFVSECKVWVNHAYMDFDINMNFNPDSFLFGEKKLMHIFEMGKTPYNFVVKANMYLLLDDSISCDSVENDETIWFFFPADREDIVNELNEIMQNEKNGHPWVPDFSDYRVEFVNNLSDSSDHLVVYKHISCWDKDAAFVLDNFDDIDLQDLGIESIISEDEDDDDANLMFRLIPNVYSKEDALTEQWKSRQWYFAYPSLRDYVESLAYGDDVHNFFGWLFDDYRFNNCSKWNLPPDNQRAFEQFLNLFFDLDEM